MPVLALPALPLWFAAIALTLALAIRSAIPQKRRRRVSAKLLARALLPRRMLRSASGRLDIAAFLFAMLLAGTMLGWALVSADWWAAGTLALLGPPPAAPRLPGWIATPLVTLALFLAYEAAYWLNHALSHRIGWLWAFHKVHHSAESLSLLTNFRVHPVDTIIFYNMAAAITGIVGGALLHLLGPAAQATVGGANVAVFVGTIVLSYLQHSHLWIAAPGGWGRVMMSPAHHQLHHSADERHHGRNFGSTLALFDWAAGTLLRPTAQRQRLRFGVDDAGAAPHGARDALLRPFAEAGRAALPDQIGSAATRPAA